VSTPSLPQTNAALRARLDDLLGEYERLRHQASTAQQRMRALTGSARSSDGAVTVGVDSRSRLTALEIDPKAYRRLSPSQLAAEVQRLYDQASADVTRQAAEVMAPFLPTGTSYQRLVNGEADPADLLADRPLSDDTYDAWRARFSGQSTVDPS
jgi:DNA-binding protein YbaB